MRVDVYNIHMLDDGITTKEAAALTGYHQKHVRYLAKKGLVKAERFGRDWMVSKSSLLSYYKKVAQLGEKRGPKPRT